MNVGCGIMLNVGCVVVELMLVHGERRVGDSGNESGSPRRRN